MNKIISISVWGDNPRYIVGARRQYELAKQLMPEWEFRVYTNTHNVIDVPDECLFDAPLGMNGCFWRFLPLFESDDNIVLSRDSDSRFTYREVQAIHEWINSDYQFHTIIDHDAHFQFPIMAGLFGNKGKLPQSLYDPMIKAAQESHYYTVDQVYLRNYVYPFIKEKTLIHTLNSDGWFGQSRKKLKNRFDFCGNGYDDNDMPLYAPTLSECAGFDPKILDNKFKFGYGIYE